MKRFLWFVVTLVVVLGALAAGSIAAFGARIGEDGVRAIVMSAGITFMLHCLTFGISKAVMPMGVWPGHMLAFFLRGIVVLAQGLIGAPLLGLPVGPALLSLAVFIFVASVIEPFFLFERPPIHPTHPPAPPAT